MSADSVESSLDIDKLLDLLLNGSLTEPNYKPSTSIPGLSETQIKELCEKAQEVFLTQSMLLELEGPLKICGDIKGQFPDLVDIFECHGCPPQIRYLFLGNYVDRGRQSIETICLLLAYKIKYPDRIYLLRGNHDCAAINRIYGFYDECKRRYSIKIWKAFNACFNHLPVSAIISGKIFCCHGGLSPELQSIDQIRQMVRPLEVPDGGLLCDLLWSDPDESLTRWADNDAGISLKFGIDIVTEFLTRHHLDLICRGHQMMDNGYQFFGNRQLVSIFSAPNFHGMMGNAAAVMSVDENLRCSLMTFHQKEKPQLPVEEPTNPTKNDNEKRVHWADLDNTTTTQDQSPPAQSSHKRNE